MNDCFQSNDYFQIDEIDSRMIGKSGINIISMGDGENKDEMIIYGGQSAVWDNPQNQDYSNYIKTNKENIKFTLLFTLIEDDFTPQMNYTLGRIFAKTKPVKFIFGEDRSKMLYVVPISNFTINRISGYKGTIPITFEATTPYWLSNPISETNISLDLNGIFSMQNICNVPNQQGNYNIYPFVKIIVANEWKILEEQGGYVKTEGNKYALTEKSMNITTENYQKAFNPDGSIKFEIIHMNDNERRIIFDGLQPGEIIEMHDIYELQSSIGISRFQNWNKEPFYLLEGVNEYKVNFPCTIETKVQFPIVK